MCKLKNWGVYHIVVDGDNRYGVRVTEIRNATPLIAKMIMRAALRKGCHITDRKKMKEFVLIKDEPLG